MFSAENKKDGKNPSELEATPSLEKLPQTIVIQE